MLLDDYLHKYRMTRNAFAHLIKYNRGSIQQVIHGHVKPGRKLIDTIVYFTNGEVSADDVLKPYKDKQENNKKEI